MARFIIEKEKLKKFYIENRLFFNCGILAILFLINCFVPHFSYFIFLLVVGIIIIDKMQIAFSTIIFCIPFCCIDEYTSVLLLFGCFAVFLIKSFIYFIFIHKKKIGRPLFYSMILFFIYVLLPIGEYNSSKFVKLLIIAILMLVFILFIHYKEEMNLKFNLNILALALIISCVLYLTYFISPYINQRNIWIVGDKFIRFSALLINPNTLAMLCEICLSLLTVFLLQNKFTWTDIIAYIIFAVLGISTFSKTFLILFSILALVLFIYLLKVFKLKTLWIIAIICFLIIFAFVFKGDYIMAYLNRFISIDSDYLSFEDLMNAITTGRYDLWTGVLDYIFMNPDVLVFGRGLGAPLVAKLSAHNFYITLLYEVGIVGFSLFIIMFLMLFNEYKRVRNQKISKAMFAPILIIGLLMMVEDLFLYIY